MFKHLQNIQVAVQRAVGNTDMPETLSQLLPQDANETPKQYIMRQTACARNAGQRKFTAALLALVCLTALCAFETKIALHGYANPRRPLQRAAVGASVVGVAVPIVLRYWPFVRLGGAVLLDIVRNLRPLEWAIVILLAVKMGIRKVRGRDRADSRFALLTAALVVITAVQLVQTAMSYNRRGYTATAPDVAATVSQRIYMVLQRVARSSRSDDDNDSADDDCSSPSRMPIVIVVTVLCVLLTAAMLTLLQRPRICATRLGSKIPRLCRT